MAGIRSSVVALAVISSAFGGLLNDPTQLPAEKVYDYIIVGSGPGGATVAARLSEDSSKNVLLIEAGINPDIDVHTQIPWDAASNTKRMHDWNFTTVPLPGYNGRSIDYARGKALGGSSTLNFMVWDRGPRDEWNHMAELTDDPGWSWDATQKYAFKVERQTVPVDGHDTTNEWDPSAHGTDGAVSVALPGFSVASGSRIIASTSEFGGEFPFIQDMSSGNSIGIGWSPSNQLNGERDSSWTAYIRPNMARPNFDVLINTYVTKVTQTGSEEGVPVFRGVEFAQNAESTTYTLNATLEVILAAGAVQTPQLLMLSGIGPTAHLAQFGITPIVPNDHVGQHLQDHPLLANSWEVHDEPDYFTYDSVRFDMERRSKYEAEWAANRTGPLVLNCCPQIGWLRVNTSLESFKGLPDPTSGPTASHYEVIFSPAWGSFSEYPPASVFAGKKHQLIITAVISPVSRGEITLQSADPWAAPLINPNFLGDAEGYDAAVMREAVKAMLKFSTSNALSDYLVGPVGELAVAAANGTDEAFTEYARNWSTTVWHPASTAKMAPWNSTEGVLNPDLTVKGTIGLRVVDLSAFPRVTASHPMFSLYIVAERASDLIKAAHP